MFCGNCGAKLPDDAKFCEECGSRVEQEEGNLTQTGPAVTEPAGDALQPNGMPQPNGAPQPDGMPQPNGAPQPNGMPQLDGVPQPNGAPQSNGIPQPNGAPQSNGMPKPNGMPGATSQAPKKKMSKKMWILIGCGGALVILLLAVILFLVFRSEKVNLNDYISFNVSGYDSVGRAEYEFDMEAFLEDYGEKIKLTGKAKSGIDWLDELSSALPAAELMISDCVDASLSQTDSLSNGDVITLIWNCDEERAKEYYGCRLVYEDIEYEVQGLDQIETFDPFADIELVFSGIAPDGRVELLNHSTDPIVGELYYTVTPSDGLSNGMTVEVSIDDSNMNYWVENYGMVPAETSKEFTVEGLGSYALTLAEIPADTLDAMKAQSEDAINAYVARDWEEYVILNSATYLGSYMLVPKDLENDGYDIDVYMVYKLQIHEYAPEEGVDNTFESYIWIKFENPIVLPDGSGSVDLSDYELCGDRFRRTITWGSGIFNERTLTYRGYENLDSLFNTCVTSRIDEYAYESTVEDTAPVTMGEETTGETPEGEAPAGETPGSETQTEETPEGVTATEETPAA